MRPTRYEILVREVPSGRCTVTLKIKFHGEPERRVPLGSRTTWSRAWALAHREARAICAVRLRETRDGEARDA